MMAPATVPLVLNSPVTIAAAAPESSSRINPTKRVLRFIVPLTDGPTYLGDIELAVSPSDDLSVVAPRLLQILEPILKDDRLARLKSALGQGNELTKQMLATAGLTLRYDNARLALAIDIPVDARRGRSFSLRGDRGSRSQTLQPASVSGYVNLRSSFDAVEQGPGRGLVAPISSIEGAIRVAGIVAESEAYLSLRPGEPRLRRIGSRFVYDDLKDTLRVTLGDLATTPRAFQSAPLLGGVAISRFYNVLDPQRDVRSGGVQNFSILSPSIVETFVNSRSVERKTLQPGTYSLQDFTLAEGANQVRLQIEDAAGQKRNIDFSVYSNLALLEPGLTEFSGAAGVYASPTRGGIGYGRQWAATGFVRRGLSPQLTAGVNAQADSTAEQAGAEMLIGTDLGLIGFDLAGSRRRSGGNGFAAALEYQRVLGGANGGNSQSVHASVEYRSSRFAIPGALLAREPISWRASADYSLNLGADKFVSGDIQYQRDRVQRVTIISARATAGWRIGRMLGAIAEVEWDHGGNRRGVLVSLGLRQRLGTRGSARADADSRGRASVSVQDSGGTGVGAWAGDADLNRTPGQASVDLNGSYVANRADLGVQQSLTLDRSGLRINEARTSLRVGTSIAFADGGFAIGRPITDAFLIASPHSSLKGTPLRLDPYESSDTAHSGQLGPALDGALSAYSSRTLIYDVPGAPPGYDLGQGNVALVPPYRGGYRLEIGSDYHLLVIGRLLDADGEPISLLAGKAIDLKAPRHPVLTIFTARNGKFGAQGLRPGEWRIEMPGTPPTTFEFIVHDSADGTVRVGDLRPVDTKRVKQ